MTLSLIRRVLLSFLVLIFTCQPLLSKEAGKDRASEASSTVPALNEFHSVLYMVYHYYMPQDSLEEIKVSIGKLQEKMAALNKVTLPPRFKGKEESFTAARKQLDKTVTELAAMVPSNVFGKIKAAIEVMHTSYKTLAEVFE